MFSPISAPWRYERDVLSQHWPLNEQEFWPGKSYDYNGYIDIIAAGRNYRDKGRPNMLLASHLNELDRINQVWWYFFNVPTSKYDVLIKKLPQIEFLPENFEYFLWKIFIISVKNFWNFKLWVRLRLAEINSMKHKHKIAIVFFPFSSTSTTLKKCIITFQSNRSWFTRERIRERCIHPLIVNCKFNCKHSPL